MCISKAQSTYSDLPSMAEMRYLERSGGISSPGRRQRSLSLSVYEDSRAKDLAERMKHTFEFKLQKSKGSKQVKGNTRSDYIQASFMTLEELLIQLPESVNFDIEISDYSPKSCQICYKLTSLSSRISNALRSPRLGDGHLRH